MTKCLKVLLDKEHAKELLEPNKVEFHNSFPVYDAILIDVSILKFYKIICKYYLLFHHIKT